MGFTGKRFEWNSGLGNSVPAEFDSHASSGEGPPEWSEGHALGPQLLNVDYSKVMMETDSLPRLRLWTVLCLNVTSRTWIFLVYFLCWLICASLWKDV